MRDLLSDPPDGISYVTYADALKSGELRETASFRLGRNPPHNLGELAVASGRVGLHGLRRLGILLPDPVRWWQVVGHFDVVHVHCFPVRLFGDVPPVVVTDSAGTFWYWTAAQGRTAEDVWRLLRRERWVARRFRYIHPSVATEKASSTFYFVESGLALAEKAGMDVAAVRVCPAGVPSAVRHSEQRLDPPTLLFVAHNFEIKGGADAVTALRELRSDFPECRLVVAGSGKPDPHIEGVDWLGPVSRDTLYRDVYPRADLFVYPTRFDVAPLVVAEALAHGIPVVTPRVFGLPDLVRDGETGILIEPDRPDALVGAIRCLLADPDRLRQMGRAARADFEARLSSAVRNEVLGRAYRHALAARQPA